MRSPSTTLLLLLVNSSCEDQSGKSGTGRDTEGDPCPSGTLLDGEDCVPEACGLAPWGDIEEVAYYVDASASADGDGSAEAPFKTIAEALSAMGDGEGGRVAIAAGTYEEEIDLRHRHAGTALVGRCMELVTMVGGASDAALDAYTRSEGDLFEIRDLTVESDYVAINVEGAHLLANRIDVTRAGYVGIVALLPDTVLELNDVSVSQVSEVEGHTGAWGVAAFEQATIEATDLVIEDIGGDGLVTVGSTTNVSGCTISKIAEGAEEKGFAVVVQGGEATLEGCTIEHVYGFGLSADSGADVTLKNSTINGLGDQGTQDLGGCVSLHDATFTMEDSTLQHCTLSSISAYDSNLTLANSAVRETASLMIMDEDDNENGIYSFSDSFAISATDSVLEATGLTLTDNANVSLLLDGTEAFISDSTIVGTYSASEWMDAAGVLVQASADVHLSNSTISNNISFSLRVIGASLTLDEVIVEDTLPDAEGWGAALSVENWNERDIRGSVIARESSFSRSHMNGLHLLASDMELTNVTIDSVEPAANEFGGVGLLMYDNANLVAEGLIVRHVYDIGVQISDGSSASLDGVTVEDVRSVSGYSMANGFNVQVGSTVDAQDIEISAVEGMGISVLSASLDCDKCAIDDVEFAGVAAMYDSSFYLGPGSTVANVNTGNLGGGIGVLLAGDGGDIVADIDGLIVTAVPLAAIYLAGPGAYKIQNSTLTGGAAQGTPSIFPMNNAIFATGDIPMWNGRNGLLLQDNTFRDHAGGAVFLDNSSARLSGNTWSGNEIDLIQQNCIDADPMDVDLSEVGTASVCGDQEYDHRVELLDFYLYFPTYTYEG